MSSVSVSATIHGRAVPVTAEPSIDVAVAMAAVPFREWCRDLSPSLHVHSIHFQSVDMFGPRVGFLKFKTQTTLGEAVVPGIVFMRGGAVSILPILTCGGDTFVLLCRQARVPAGFAAFPEIPAGMLDGSGKFSGVAAKEMEEETGLVITEESLVDMTELAYGGSEGVTPRGGTKYRGMYPTVGGSDEFIRLFLFRKEVSPEEMAALQGKLGGCVEEGEVISLEVVPYDKVWRLCPDSKTLASILLYEKLKAAGTL